jgi:ABC-type Na+ transport system ATPase subunit NatA
VPEPAIVVDALEKSFPPTRSGWRTFLQPFEKPTAVALAGLSFAVREGEALALLGANGAGKSTLLRILATLLLPTRGATRVAGYDAVRRPREVRRRLGYHAGTDHGFYARLTGRENLRFFGRLNHLSDAAAQLRISQLGEQFGLGEALDRQVRTLSSGTV